MKHHYTYRITNIILNKHYYGVRSCLCEPKDDLGYTYFSSSLDKEFKKDQKENPQNYKYKVLRISETRELAISLEIKLHAKFNVVFNESFYNRSNQKTTSFTSNRAGFKVSEETKIKIGNFFRGKKLSKEHRKKISEGNKGKKLSKEVIENLRIINTGKKHSDETKEKLRQLNLGKNHSEETKIKISEGNKGKTMSDETKKKISQSHIGMNLSEEAKKKISETKAGVKVHTDEHKEFLRINWTGPNNPNFGKPLLEETRDKISKTKLNAPLIKCPYCAIASRNMGVMKRWHLENCKHKQELNNEN